MDFPSFDDFLADMGEARFAQWNEAANEKRLSLHAPLTPEAMTEFAQTVVTATTSIVSAMMRDYHEWLIAQIQSCGLRLL